MFLLEETCFNISQVLQSISPRVTTNTDCGSLMIVIVIDCWSLVIVYVFKSCQDVEIIYVKCESIIREHVENVSI